MERVRGAGSEQSRALLPDAGSSALWRPAGVEATGHRAAEGVKPTRPTMGPSARREGAQRHTDSEHGHHERLADVHVRGGQAIGQLQLDDGLAHRQLRQL